MKMLVVFAVGVLGCSLAGAVTVSKCDLMEQLMTAIKSLPENIQQSGLASNDFVAKLVCHVELASEFNTNAVTEMSHGQGGSSEDGHQAGDSEGSHEGNNGGQHRRRRSSPGVPSTADADKNMTLYGLFQLCGHLVCHNGIANPTILCDMKCTDLTDDNIKDDIDCVLNLFTEIVQKGFQARNLRELRQVIRLIMPDNCKDVKADFYFAECKNVPQTMP